MVSAERCEGSSVSKVSTLLDIPSSLLSPFMSQSTPFPYVEQRRSADRPIARSAWRGCPSRNGAIGLVRRQYEPALQNGKALPRWSASRAERCLLTTEATNSSRSCGPRSASYRRRKTPSGILFDLTRLVTAVAPRAYDLHSSHLTVQRLRYTPLAAASSCERTSRMARTDAASPRCWATTRYPAMPMLDAV